MLTNMKDTVEIGDSQNGVSVGKFLPTFEGSFYSLHLEGLRSPTAPLRLQIWRRQTTPKLLQLFSKRDDAVLQGTIIFSYTVVLTVITRMT